MCQFLESSHKARTTYLGSPEPALGSLEGCKIVAGGRRPPERNSIVRRHPEGVQDVPISRHKALAPLQGANYQDAPGGLRSDLRLLSYNPPGCRHVCFT